MQNRMHFMAEIDKFIEVFQKFLEKICIIFLTLLFSIVFLYVNQLQFRLLLKIVVLGLISLFLAFFVKFQSVLLNCNNKCYALKCHKRKMEILEKLNNRLFEKVIKEDDKIEKNKFYKSKSFYVYMGLMKFFSLIPLVFLRVSLNFFYKF